MTAKQNFCKIYSFNLFSFSFPLFFTVVDGYAALLSLCLSNIVSALSHPPERETEQGARRDRMTQRQRERERMAMSQNLVS